ncbi:hypothetical protein AAF712_011580 [Marasmius tenuissimus]|uniref:F-box domain-containing protein n=1 Tax=Marasmius tenuissimus TaxID=585030 RepID=A0ABR2ZKS5_9AGAR
MASSIAFTVTELLNNTLSFLSSIDLKSAILVCKNFQETGERMLHSDLKLTPKKVDVAEGYVERTAGNSSFKKLEMDLAVDFWRIISILRLLPHRSRSGITSLEISASTHSISPGWAETTNKLSSRLRTLLPAVVSLVIQPIHYSLQEKMLQSFSAVTTLTLFEGLTTIHGHEWSTFVLPSLTNLTLVTSNETSTNLLPLVDRYLCAARLTHLTIALHSRDRSQFEAIPRLCRTYQPTLSFLRIIGSDGLDVYSDDFFIEPIPSSGKLREIDIESCIMHVFLPFEGNQAFPALETLVIEASFRAIDKGWGSTNWERIVEVIDRLRSVSAKLSTVSCGYRRGEPVQGYGCRDVFIKRLKEAATGSTLGFPVEQVCRPELPRYWRPTDNQHPWGDLAND